MFPDFSGLIYLAYLGVFGVGLAAGLLALAIAALFISIPTLAFITGPFGVGMLALFAFRLWVGE